MTTSYPAYRATSDDRTARGSVRAIQVWLAVVAGLVLAMIVVGGATRLTDSGLSITEWQPLLGALPPLSEADWLAAFEKYKTTLQYASVNKGMSLAAFKAIYWWEWAHRFLGRFIGVAFALPFLAFWAAGRLPRGLALKLVGVLALGGLQGFAGWYMVQSGLTERIDVSQHRLALHLSIAFLILGLLVWLILDIAPRRAGARLKTLAPGDRLAAYVLAALVFSQVVIGGFVAGLKAGRAYNTWPLMDGRLVPDGYWRLEPWWANLTDNMATVQFNHRLAAYLIVAFAVWHAVRVARRADDERVWTTALLLMAGLAVQMGLGIWTVLAAVPIELGIVHQGFAAVMFALSIAHAHRVAREGV